MRKWLSIIILIVIQICTKHIKTIRIRRNNTIIINQRDGNIIEKRYYPKYFINNPLGIKNKRKKNYMISNYIEVVEQPAHMNG